MFFFTENPIFFFWGGGGVGGRGGLVDGQTNRPTQAFKCDLGRKKIF